MADDSLFEAATRGDRRATLEALRDQLALVIDVNPDHTGLAALSKQLVEVLREIDSLPAPKETSVVDDLAFRRADRIARASGS